MKRINTWFFGAGAAALAMAAQGFAQDPETTPQAPAEIAPVAPETPATTDPNQDEMADYLNSQQQLRQSFTVTRTINGQVVETDKRTVIYSRDDPTRPTEAGVSAIDAMSAAFDSELLTRTEAFEEAKLDFVVADQNHNGSITADEFAILVASWRADAARDTSAPTDESARERQYRAFIEELDPEAAKADMEANARAKFAFMAGAAGTMSREDYIREYLLDFDSMDTDGDLILKSDELMQFRALNRGERLDS